MTILTRYLIREIIRHFCIVMGVVIVIYLAVDFLQKIGDFLEAGAPVTLAFWYFLFKIPLTVSQMLPLSILLATLITFGLMNKRNELITLKSSGVSIFHLLKPVVALGVLSAVLLFFLSEMVVPAAMTRANRILNDVKGGTAITDWVKGDRSFFKIGQYDPENQVIIGFTAYYLDSEFRYRKRLDAKRAAFENGKWVLQDLVMQTFDPETGDPAVSLSSREVVDIDLNPDGLEEVTKSTDEWSCRDLRAVIRKIEAEGYDATVYRVNLQYKRAFPLVCLVLCLIGIAIAVRSRLKEQLPVIVSYGIAVAFLYFIIMSFCVSLGRGGVLPPVVAAWATHALFLCAGGVALINAQS